jgi:hypothetical protein
MNNKDVKKTIKKAYSKIATGSDSCCSCGCTNNDSQTAKRISKEIGKNIAWEKNQSGVLSYVSYSNFR